MRYIRSISFPSAEHYYDLLEPGTLARLAAHPEVLEQELQVCKPNHVVIIDEIQKLPMLLDVVQRMMERKRLRFLLTGSSARKLKSQGQGVNLLGGRAWEAQLFPLVYPEIPDFDLTRYLNHGGIPKTYLSAYPWEDLRAYVGLYLKEEILAEALVRKLNLFARFLEVAAIQSGEELHLEGIASDAGIGAKTVGNYIELLEDTLVGYQLPPLRKTKKRKAITRSKFYFFDVGVTNYLAKRAQILPGSELFGKAFEQFIVGEVRAFLSYTRSDLEMSYWRSVNGQEVDLIIGEELAIEIKSTSLVLDKHLKGLKALAEERMIRRGAVVSLDPKRRIIGDITVYPWKEFLDLLWARELIPT